MKMLLFIIKKIYKNLLNQLFLYDKQKYLMEYQYYLKKLLDYLLKDLSLFHF